MTLSLKSTLLSFASLTVPAVAFAQTITTDPVTPVPVSGPLGLVLLAVLLLGAAAWLLRQPRTHPALVAVAVLGGTLLWQGATFLAQSSSSFTNPAGETLPIQVTPIPSGNDVAGWEWADFTNATSSALAISEIVEPTFAQCLPGGLVGTLLPPGTPPASPPAACSEGLALAAGATCRVDVDTICRAASTGQLATMTSIAPTSGSLAGGVLVTVTGTNLTGATSVTFGGVAATSVTVVNATTVTAVAPAHALGTVDVVVGTPRGSATLANGYAYVSGSTLTTISPSSGAASGGVGVTLTGTGLTGATAVTFGGVAATSVNVVNATTVTAVTPAHAVGAADVVIATPAGGATLASGYTYLATSVGQPSGGGIIAALNGGLNNLIAATADHGGIEWGGFGTAIGAGAQSTTDGASNTSAIVMALGNNGGVSYAAQSCSNYEVDSQGNTPCQAGNTCYNDWFVPAGGNLTAAGQLNALYTNRVAVGGFVNDYYFSSTEYSGLPAVASWAQFFGAGVELAVTKDAVFRVRCVRVFTP